MSDNSGPQSYLPAIQQPETMEKYEDTGDKKHEWVSDVGQVIPQPNINLQAQNSASPDYAAVPERPLEDSARGGYTGRDPPRGSSDNNGRDRRHHNNVGPVFVEGAPTGPAAMRNGGDRGRGSRGRVAQRGNFAHTRDPGFEPHDVSTVKHDSITRDHDRRRGRSMTRSVTRERSLSRARQEEKGTRRRSPSIERSRRRRRRSRSPQRDSRRRISTSDRRDRSKSPRRNEAVKENDRKSNKDERQKAENPLFDRIGTLPTSRSGSPEARRSKSHRSSRRSRRRRSRRRDRSRSKSRSRSRSPARPTSEKKSSRRKRSSRSHKAPEPEQSATSKRGEQSRSRSRERSQKKSSSRRSNFKKEMSAAELRRLEDERDHSRYR